MAINIEQLQNELLQSHDRIANAATDTIKSFNFFMKHMLEFIVREFSSFELVSENNKHTVHFGNVVVHKPIVQDLEASQKNIRVLTNTPLMPMEARNRGLTYAAEILVNINHTVTNIIQGQSEQFSYREVPLMQMPVMLRSEYCHLSDTRNLECLKECASDPGGYFIIRGNAKVLQPQKVQRINVHVIKQGSANQPINLEIRSLKAEVKFRSTSTLYVHYSGTPLVFTADLPYIAEGQNIVLLFRALGLTGQSEIEDFLWAKNYTDPRRRYFASTLATCAASNPEVELNEVYDTLGKGIYNQENLGTCEKIRRQVAQQITGELLPHCGFDDSAETRYKKLLYLRTIVRQMIDVHMGTQTPDDRDFEGYKAVHLSATLFSTMFRQLFSAFVKSIRNKMFDRFKRNKHLDIAAFVAHSESLTRDILKAFSDGEMTVRQACNAGTNVIQIAHQINPLGLTTHMQRVNTALPKDGKYTLMRGVDSTQLFTYCPAETPEGHGAGLLQNLTLFAKVRLGTESNLVTEAILHAVPEFAKHQCGIQVPLVFPLGNVLGYMQLFESNNCLVFVNGEPCCYTQNPNSLLNVLRKARRARLLPIDASVILSHYGLLVFTDMGTVQFPLLRLDLLKTLEHKLYGMPGELFRNMLFLGIIEYVEAWEALDYRVAFKGSDLVNPALQLGLRGEPSMPFTHLAIHPMAFLGTSASSVPWSDHDQAPRVSYQAGMLKQAVSTPATNLSDRFDIGCAHTLWYPQKPMADTIVSKSRKVQEWPMGENLIIAIASYEGLSQEDAIVRNRAGIDRGSGRITVHKVYKAVEHKRISVKDYETFESPFSENTSIPCIGMRAECDYSKIDFNGVPEEGTFLKNNDILIGRVLYTADDSGNRVRRDRSIILNCEELELYVVDKVLFSTNRDGFRQIRVRIRSMRVPQVGDKISDRHGQKGVIGFLANQEDLPFVADGPNAGMVPDAIVNLHSINGRMTIGKLLEMLYSNLGLALGSFIDASPFQSIDAKWAIQELLKAGFGTECTMINGKTGKVMENSWFIGSCFYQSLKHMVLDKIAARNRGPRAVLTRQPLEGRAKQGGLRVGEMERDALLAHGASMVLDDRSRVASDGHVAAVCTRCGQIGESTTEFTIKGLLESTKHNAIKGANDLESTKPIGSRKHNHSDGPSNVDELMRELENQADTFTDSSEKDLVDIGALNLDDQSDEALDHSALNDDGEALDHSALNDDAPLRATNLCRLCDGPIQEINTTYCYSNLLVRELATVGIKIEHGF